MVNRRDQAIQLENEVIAVCRNSQAKFVCLVEKKGGDGDEVGEVLLSDQVDDTFQLHAKVKAGSHQWEQRVASGSYNRKLQQDWTGGQVADDGQMVCYTQ